MKRGQGQMWLLNIILAGCLLFSGGCIYLVAGGIGALGGYVISPDTVEGMTSHSQDELWDAAYEILSIMGSIDDENQSMGQIVADVAGAQVSVSVVTVNLTATKLTVKSRKSMLPRISIAQDVYAKIIGYLEG